MNVDLAGRVRADALPAGTREIRLVLDKDHDQSDLYDAWVRQGFEPLWVLARESVPGLGDGLSGDIPQPVFSFLVGEAIELHKRRLGRTRLRRVQAGNEPFNPPGGSSWTLPVSHIEALIGEAFNHLADPLGTELWGPGLGDGIASQWTAVANRHAIKKVCAHLYGVTATDAPLPAFAPGGPVENKIADYRRVLLPGQDLEITEVGVREDEFPGTLEQQIHRQADWFTGVLRACAAAGLQRVFIFCNDTDMVGGYGIRNGSNGAPKDAFGAIERFIAPNPRRDNTFEVAWRARWRERRPNAEYHPDWGIETAWRAAQGEWGAPLTDQEQTVEWRGRMVQGRVFSAAGLVVWVPERGAVVVGWP